MKIRREIVPFVAGSVVAAALVALACWGAGVLPKTALTAGGVFLAVACLFFLQFFRDPERTPPADESAVVAGADGVVMRIRDMPEEKFLKTEAVRISIFLSPINVHVNRSPIAGTVTYLEYFPGRRYFTFDDRSSDCNQHSSILIEGVRTRCLLKQICGPVCRRVVFWLERGQVLKAGDRVGMMKFGSRLDMYFPKADVEVVIGEGQKVRAGVTVVARTRGGKTA